MKPFRILFAKAIFLSLCYILLVVGLFVAIEKLAGMDITLESVTLMIATSAILLHFMDKENQEQKKEDKK